MSDVGGQDRTQEIARGLSQIVTQALDDSTPSRAMDAARELALSLSLPGLDRLLGVLAQYAGGAWPAPLRPVVERMRRAAAECARDGDLAAFRRLDDELGLMARAIERVPLGRPSTTGPAPPDMPAIESAPVVLADALEGVPGERGDAELLRRVRLRPPVAGALRAALEWLVGGNTARMRMWLTSDGSALDVTCEGISFTGLHPAAEVLASVGAHLGPAGTRPGAWTVRVPIRAERETFLLLEQDELQLAVPWHAVVRVRLIPADTIDVMLRRQGLPVLPPLAVSARRAVEQPVTVVALGLKRACLVADRLVWRMSAEPVAPLGVPPAEGIVRAVQSDDGEVHWVLDPDWLLRGVAAPAMARPGFRPSATPAAPPDTPVGAATPLAATPVPHADPEVIMAPEAPAAEPPPNLEPEHLEAPEDSSGTPQAVAPPGLASEPEADLPGTPPEFATPEPVQEPPAPHSGMVRRALVAEDSIAARIYLVRLLEQQGFVVHAVTSAAELRESLPHGPWTLICADGELPDARGDELLLELVQAAATAGSALVALVRDDIDERTARGAGVTATLRKPFAREALEVLLERLAPGVPGGSDDGSGNTAGGPDPREWGAR